MNKYLNKLKSWSDKLKQSGSNTKKQVREEIDKELELYERLCVGCPCERICHETCENCEEYEEELQKIEEQKKE